MSKQGKLGLALIAASAILANELLALASLIAGVFLVGYDAGREMS